MHIKISIVTSTDTNCLHITERKSSNAEMSNIQTLQTFFISVDRETILFSQEERNKLHTNHLLWVAMCSRDLFPIHGAWIIYGRTIAS